MRKRSIAALLTLFYVIMALTAATVSAEMGNVDDIIGEKSSRLTLKFSVGGNPVSGAAFFLYKVGTYKSGPSEDGSYGFELAEGFKEADVDLTGLIFSSGESYAEEMTDLVKTLVDHIDKEEVKYDDSRKTSTDGEALFPDLAPGLYLVRGEETEIEGTTYTPQSFLIPLPYPVDGGFNYKVTANAKHEPVNTVTVKKIWVGGGNHPSSVTAQLFDEDNNEIDTAVLNEGNNWIHTWTVDPDHTWKVKEAEVPAGYTATVDQNGNEFTITNTRASSTGGQEERITVKKVWKGGSDHPGSVTVQLLRDGKLFGEQVLSSGNSWSCTWTTSVSGHTWSINEPDVPEGYTFDVTWEGNAATVTNTFESLTEPTPSPGPSPTPGPTPTPAPTPDPTPVPTPNPSPVPTPTPPGNPDLPQTSQLWWPVPLLAAAGVVLLLIGTVLFVRKEEERGPHE